MPFFSQMSGHFIFSDGREKTNLGKVCKLSRPNFPYPQPNIFRSLLLANIFQPQFMNLNFGVQIFCSFPLIFRTPHSNFRKSSEDWFGFTLGDADNFARFVVWILNPRNPHHKRGRLHRDHISFYLSWTWKSPHSWRGVERNLLRVWWRVREVNCHTTCPHLN